MRTVGIGATARLLGVPAKVGLPPTAADFRTIPDGPQSTHSGRSLPSIAMLAHARPAAAVRDYLPGSAQVGGVPTLRQSLGERRGWADCVEKVDGSSVVAQFR